MKPFDYAANDPWTRRDPFWTPARLEQALITFALIFALVLGYAIGANKGYDLGSKDGIRYGTQETCADLPDSEHYSPRCRP